MVSGPGEGAPGPDYKIRTSLFLGFHGRRCLRLHPLQAEAEPELVFDIEAHVGMIGKESFGVFTALADAFVLIGVPGAALVDDIVFHGEIEQVAGLGNSFSIDDVEFGDLETAGQPCS